MNKNLLLYLIKISIVGYVRCFKFLLLYMSLYITKLICMLFYFIGMMYVSPNCTSDVF